MTPPTAAADAATAPEPLVLGPLLRYVDETSASVWVETSDRARVTVRAADRTWSARTFAVHGHHYALVEVDGLEPGTRSAYGVDVDGTEVWPPADPSPDEEFPPSTITTLTPGKPLRMAFGSCRTSVGHDTKGNLLHGVDAMRAFALRMAGDDPLRWPDLMLFLGDQVYADETTEAMEEFIAARRDVDEAPWDELKDYEEYAHLYRLAWTDPANRWLLSTLPTAMIFDDHDIRDDWNTSLTWKRQMQGTDWWHQRIVSGLASYWVYQHLGNLSPAERAEDEVYAKIVAAQDDEEELDLTETLEAFADRADREPDSYRWSFARDLGGDGEVRLVVVDSRAARVLDPDNRCMLDPKEMAWLDGQMQGGFRHLLVGTSLPYLLAPGLHHFEAWNEALSCGAWGRLGGRVGEWIRQKVDLEHWAAFQHGFLEVADMVLEVAYGERGAAPETVTFLSGDVHHSYVAEVRRVRSAARRGNRPGAPRSRIVQAVCSPIRNPLPRHMRLLTALASYAVAGPMGALAARSARVPDPPFTWGTVRGPWFDNNLALLEDTPEGLAMSWHTGVVDEEGPHAPRLELVAATLVAGPPSGRRTAADLVRGLGRRLVTLGSRSAALARRFRGGRSR